VSFVVIFHPEEELIPPCHYTKMRTWPGFLWEKKTKTKLRSKINKSRHDQEEKKKGEKII